MNCLVISATAMEIGPFLHELRSGKTVLPFTDVLITGIGLTATTWSLTRQLRQKPPDLVIQAGIAGCFDPSIKLGTVFVVKKDTIADLGVAETGKFNTIFDMGLARENQFPYKKGWLVNDHDLLKKVKLKKIKAISCNEISTSEQKINFYKKKFSPLIESMEGAALHYVCLMENIPFLQIRSVSNYIRERNKKKWAMKESVFSLNKELTRLLHSL